MRTNLQKYDGKRLLFTGKVIRYGLKNNFRGEPSKTILISNICFEDGSKATNHIWFIVGKKINKLNLLVNEEIEFVARIKQYFKGYINHRENLIEKNLDFKLSNPTKFKRLIKIEKSRNYDTN